MDRQRAIPIAVALLVGAAVGLFYAWVVSPVQYVDTAPASLRADFQADYLTLIAAAYADTGDLVRARARLSLIPEADPAARLASLAQQRLASGFPGSEAEALAALASALGEGPLPAGTATFQSGGPSATPRPSRTPTASAPPPATRTPTATPGAPFQLVGRELVCDPDRPEPLLMVEVEDSAGRPVPGVEVLVVWDAGQDHFFTGLKHEISPGYGDFTMEPGVTYTAKLAQTIQTVTGLRAEVCTAEDGSTAVGSWRLTYAQPPATPAP